ncbi:MAG: glycosyltransferase [Holophagaceae bacterium]|nr:glycosyltransferase [Holophagaceae bacterium]
MSLISLAMIVKNEGATLGHCLESVRPIVDEMVIVDTGSTDKTIEIARSFGARVYHFDWCDDFAAARNESLKYCTGEWILILDADEAIDPLDYEKIRDSCLNPFADSYAPILRHYLATGNLASQDGAPVPNKSAYGEGKNHPFYVDTETPRLAKAFDGLGFEGRIHETLRNSLLSHGRSISRLGAVIHHYGKLFADREEHKSKYYLTLAREEAISNPREKWAQYNLLQQALAANEWEVALEAAKKSLELHIDTEPLVPYGAGLALQQLGRFEEAMEYFDLLLDERPGHAMATLRKGSCYMALGNFNVARELMTKAIALEPGYIQSYGCLAELELGVNNIGAARNIALEALEIAPGEPGLYDILINVEIADDDFGGAARWAIKGIENCPERAKAAWYRVASAYLLKEGQAEAGKSLLERGLEAFPGDSELMRLKKMVDIESQSKDCNSV